MDDSLEIKCTNTNHISLDESYREGIKKVIGDADQYMSSFETSKTILEKRRKFWDLLLKRYTLEVSDETELDIYSLKPIKDSFDNNRTRLNRRLSLNLVQYWVDTGNSPHGMLIDKENHLGIDRTLNVSEPSNNSFIQAGSKIRDLTQTTNDQSSGTSVNTVAYILSNTNVTKRADTVAILESAKYSNLSNSETRDVPKPNVSTEMLEIASANNRFTSKGNDYRRNMFSIDWKKSVIRAANLSAKILEDTNICQTISRPPLANNDKINQNITRNQVQICSYVDQEKDSVEEDEKEEPELFSVLEKTTEHKKLYNVRDSPVDIALIKRNNTRRISKSLRREHPALDLVMTPESRSSKFQFYQKKRRKWISKYKRSLSNSRILTRRRAKKIENIEKKKKNDAAKVKLLDKSNDSQLATEQEESIVESISRKKVTTVAETGATITNENNIGSVTSKSLGNLQPVVRLTRLSVPSLRTGNQEGSRSSKKTDNLSPIVVLTRILESDLPERYRYRNTNTNTNMNTNRNKSADRRSSIDSKTYSKVTTVDDSEDTADSNQSTVLIYECASSNRDSSSNSFLTSESSRENIQEYYEETKKDNYRNSLLVDRKATLRNKRKAVNRAEPYELRRVVTSVNREKTVTVNDTCNRTGNKPLSLTVLSSDDDEFVNLMKNSHSKRRSTVRLETYQDERSNIQIDNRPIRKLNRRQTKKSKEFLVSSSDSSVKSLDVRKKVKEQEKVKEKEKEKEKEKKSRSEKSDSLGKSIQSSSDEERENTMKKGYHLRFQTRIFLSDSDETSA